MYTTRITRDSLKTIERPCGGKELRVHTEFEKELGKARQNLIRATDERLTSFYLEDFFNVRDEAKKNIIFPRMTMLLALDVYFAVYKTLKLWTLVWSFDETLRYGCGCEMKTTSLIAEETSFFREIVTLVDCSSYFSKLDLLPQPGVSTAFSKAKERYTLFVDIVSKHVPNYKDKGDTLFASVLCALFTKVDIIVLEAVKVLPPSYFDVDKSSGFLDYFARTEGKTLKAFENSMTKIQKNAIKSMGYVWRAAYIQVIGRGDGSGVDENVYKMFRSLTNLFDTCKDIIKKKMDRQFSKIKEDLSPPPPSSFASNDQEDQEAIPCLFVYEPRQPWREFRAVNIMMVEPKFSELGKRRRWQIEDDATLI